MNTDEDETSGLQTPDTQSTKEETTKEREETQRTDSATNREEKGKGEKNREGNGHANDNGERGSQERVDDAGSDDTPEDTMTDERESRMGEDKEGRGHGTFTPTTIGGIPDMPPPLSPRIKLYRNGAEKIARRQKRNRQRARDKRPPRITAELARIIQADNNEKQQVLIGHRTNKAEEDGQDRIQTGSEEDDPNAVIRRLQEQLRNMQARMASSQLQNEKGLKSGEGIQTMDKHIDSRKQEDKTSSPECPPTAEDIRTSGGATRKNSAKKTKRTGVKRYFYAVVLARHGPPGVYDSRAAVEALDPIKIRRFETESDAVAFLVAYQSRNEEVSEWQTQSKRKHAPKRQQNHRLRTTKQRQKHTRENVDVQEGRRGPGNKQMKKARGEKRTNSPRRRTSDYVQRGRRSPRLRVDDSVCRDEDLHALMDKIDAITMAQDTHAREVRAEIDDITRTRAKHEQEVCDTDETSIGRRDDHSIGGGIHAQTGVKDAPLSEGWDRLDATTTESDGSETLPYNPLTIPQQEHQEYQMLARDARRRGETPPPYVNRCDRDIDRVGVSICQDWMATQRGRRSRQRRPNTRGIPRDHITPTLNTRTWREHGDPGHDFGTTHDHPVGDTVIPVGDQLYNTTALSGHHRDFTMWADVHAHTTHLLCTSGPRRRNRIPCPGRKRYRIWFHVPMGYLYNTITQERVQAGLRKPFELCLRNPRVGTNPVVMSAHHAPVDYTRLPVLDLYLHERPDTGEGMQPAMFAYHEARINAIKRGVALATQTTEWIDPREWAPDAIPTLTSQP